MKAPPPADIDFIKWTVRNGRTMPPLSPVTLHQLVEALDNLTPGEVPIASAKRISTAIALGGAHFRIGRIWANRAFVVRRGQANLLYVHVAYQGYAKVARRVFSPTSRRDFDYDHALGRAIARNLGYSYVLLLRVPKAVNRSHGRYEHPVPRGGLNLQKTCLTDARILRKMLGLKADAPGQRTSGYDQNASHNPPLSEVEYRAWAFALGVDPGAAHPTELRAIPR